MASAPGTGRWSTLKIADGGQHGHYLGVIGTNSGNFSLFFRETKALVTSVRQCARFSRTLRQMSRPPRLSSIEAFSLIDSPVEILEDFPKLEIFGKK
jgi:hypothetical protein